MKQKIAQFVARHGYTLRSFIVSALLFPPAALFIALKHPSWSVAQRVLALSGLAVFLAVIPMVGAAVFAGLYKLLSI